MRKIEVRPTYYYALEAAMHCDEVNIDTDVEFTKSTPGTATIITEVGVVDDGLYDLIRSRLGEFIVDRDDKGA